MRYCMHKINETSFKRFSPILMQRGRGCLISKFAKKLDNTFNIINNFKFNIMKNSH